MKKTIVLFLTAFAIMSFNTITVDDKPFVVIVDAGHGGEDSGSQKDGVEEKELTFSVAKKLRELGDEKEIKIILTRRNDGAMTITDRIDLTNDFRGDLLISIHVNADAKDSRSGIDCYVSESNIQNGESKEFGDILINNLKSVKGIGVNEIKTANFNLLEKTEIPSVLIELGYLTSTNDFNFITDNDNQDILAEKIFVSIKEFKNLK